MAAHKWYLCMKKFLKPALKILAMILAVCAGLTALSMLPLLRRHAETFTGFAMGSVLTQTFWVGDYASPGEYADQVLQDISGLEEELGSTEEVPALALEIMEATGGAFNPYLGALVKLWNIDGKDGGEPYVPAQAEIDEALQKQELDLGAYGKGAACDAALLALQSENGPKSALINLGGNILTYKSKPWNRPFKVALRDPKGGANDTFGMFKLKGTHFISTTGSYEKYFEQDGVRYHHVLDPETGYPAQRDPGLLSVTVISAGEHAGAAGDMLSTASFVLGYDNARTILETYRCDALFVYADGTVRAAGNVKDYFAIDHPSYHWEGD